MRWLATLAVVAALISPTVASGQDYTFGDWARDQGYSPGDVMPLIVHARDSSIDSLDGIGDFDWTTTPTAELDLAWNQISSIEADAFSGLTNLRSLGLYRNQLSSIESGDFSGLTNLERLDLSSNQISSIESGDFSGLTNLRHLYLHANPISSLESGDFDGLTNLMFLGLESTQLSSIESADFSGLTNLTWLDLRFNQIPEIESGVFSGLTGLESLYLEGNTVLTELNLSDADFSSLSYFHVGSNVNIASVSLRNTLINQTSLAALLDGGFWANLGIGGLGSFGASITEMDLSGIDFVDITDLEPLYAMDDLTDLWLVNTQNVDATQLDVLLDNLETIEGTDTEGILYMTQADYDAFNAAGGGLLAIWNDEPGHHVEYLSIGDVNHDTEVNGLDVDDFTRVLLASRFDVAADMNLDGVVNGLDVDPFVAAVVGDGVQQIPEPSTLLLCIIALGVAGGVRRLTNNVLG